jgi:hypothetical protein
MFHFDDVSIPIIYALLFIYGTARTFAWAARSSFFPTLVSRDAFANAVTWNNSSFQIGSVVGPAISDFRRSNFAPRTGGSWLAARDAGNWCVHHGPGHSVPAAYATSGQNAPLVRHWIRYRDYSLRSFESFLALIVHIVFGGRL